jgi:hypothetical protein
MNSQLPNYSFENAFARGWEVFKAHYGPVLAAALIPLGIGILFAIVGTVFAAVAGFDPLGILQALFIAPMLNAGVMLFTARLARGEAPPVGTVFDGFKVYWRVFLVNLLMMAISIVLAVFIIPGFIAMAAGAADLGLILIIVGALCVLLGAVFIQSRLGFATVIAADPAVGCRGVTDALRLSWRMTETSWVSLIGLYIVLGLIAIGCTLLLIIPLFLFAMPLMMAVIGAAYAQLSGPLVGGGFCPICGYPLDDSPDGRCPECGHRADTGPQIVLAM